ncbi:sigma-70 family RNA polymerase sigma factor [Devosia sp. 1635]|uniref:sigma-70 family RNA polymerase sigma factor n=1 Tax=Devosia sp. 1635 TaxID=2726066 RepID=UPI0020C15D0A|nr:sigma-70 family RNA polymerase sigma factor [Devosia sp. 1635]
MSQLAGLRRYALSLTRHEADAEDLVHDTLLQAHQSRRSFRPDGNLQAWLMGILHNRFIDRKRSAAAAARRDEAAGRLQPTFAAPQQEDSVRLAQVRRAFLELPEEQRSVLHLVAIEELSYQETADVLGVPIGTVMSRVARARERLREIEASPKKGAVAFKIVGGRDDAY